MMQICTVHLTMAVFSIFWTKIVIFAYSSHNIDFDGSKMHN